MAELKITELSPVGSDLFHDGESFLEELTDEDLNLLSGAGTDDDIFIKIPSFKLGKSLNLNSAANSVGKRYSSDDSENLNVQDLKGLKFYGTAYTVARSLGNNVII
ncbi:MAG: hypothetical protein ACRC2R_14125 [Xenococcaceae cyanobacterium]